ncbi:DNA-3-methyladenine glycosylase 2 family protein [Nitratireductor aquimarinus]|uniref:DNA-3-methyladenine glycosylase family protein n=1 Tax=Nitratireductor TaxID=245876 RepID=UPI0019D3DDD5|nr:MULTISPECIES: DNA-3-methyladenine glycosylase 2 family protein [Nitratireductor]MBN7778083.1 DNA-3-methyladenine glycosylase 2 family protein [Nitratireductor pacificus]MBN7782405.1 DNA-3-methyladenine glycosylase 2 family protein [Nitratireductor pacificus]MBN7791212.1 DNA-3-methyladenine glycosylase 2 family protein [Nitratireductor aquimarinus]MBY6100292.1 DNA-3-methyladenine glycosylase 2 family protein [Nitratireductor aquimarinus]MCA1259655.1 DNA-3-methyladenine glycosylase 2 family p
MHRIDTDAHILEALDALVGIDPRLEAVRARAGEVPLRRTAPGFASLVSIIVSQQVSRASADAIEGRLVRLVNPLTPYAVLSGGEEPLIAAGLSRAKQRTVLALSCAIRDDGLDLEALCALDADQAIARLTALPGIGPWTAQVYLLVAAGHPDVFPAGDVALQAAVADALALSERPNPRDLALLAESWTPLRAVAARLFWAYYRERKGHEAAPLP